jgi:hypothetical protein
VIDNSLKANYRQALKLKTIKYKEVAYKKREKIF